MEESPWEPPKVKTRRRNQPGDWGVYQVCVDGVFIGTVFADMTGGWMAQNVMGSVVAVESRKRDALKELVNYWKEHDDH